MRRRPLPGTGVELLDVDLSAPLADDLVAELRAAYDHDHLLLVRDQHLTPERQVEIAAVFGDVRDEGRGPVGYVSNVRPDGVVATGPLLFHSDFGFLPTPLGGISLFGLEVPDEGAETLFADAVAAVDRLPDRLRSLLEHTQVCNASAFRVDFAERQRERDVHPDEIRTLHPAIAPHPRTGVPVLMINESHSVRLVDLPADESDAVLDEVFGVLYGEANVYEHRWRAGDFVIFDNVAIQHGRRTFDPAAPRTLQRVVLGGEPFALTPALLELYAGANARRQAG
jgi:taurine dioxygenase